MEQVSQSGISTAPTGAPPRRGGSKICRRSVMVLACTGALCAAIGFAWSGGDKCDPIEARRASDLRTGGHNLCDYKNNKKIDKAYNKWVKKGNNHRSHYSGQKVDHLLAKDSGVKDKLAKITGKLFDKAKIIKGNDKSEEPTKSQEELEKARADETHKRFAPLVGADHAAGMRAIAEEFNKRNQ